jgi:hypothetical protein
VLSCGRERWLLFFIRVGLFFPLALAQGWPVSGDSIWLNPARMIRHLYWHEKEIRAAVAISANGLAVFRSQA